MSRVSMSRVAVSRAAVALCDAPDAAVEDAAAAPVAEAAADAEAAAKPRRRGKADKTPIESLEVGAEVEGKIRSVMSYGAFVDVGATTDGLLHVSEISNDFVQDATEKLTAGETITCKIKAINLEKKQLALTCKEPQAREGGGRRERKPRPNLSEFENADEKEFITGTVNSITDFGAFVTIKEGVDGLVHISQIQDGGVGKVEDVLSIGQEVKVRIQSVDKAKRRISLSMREWTEKSEDSGRPMRGGADSGFGESDKAFHMSSDELETLTVSDEFTSPFDTALDRMKYVQATKAAKGKYARQVL